ncbi:tRNA lysidine(34) synthetase TilS [Piscibacillus salipiscarius]|uniref:tRNA lysidine(34) synthetase TilS n=1 Tax=Piscibacillus salipiscarius TaxID=299480 RepID=UPI000AE53D08
MDPSNEQDTYTRNRIRNQVIPLLEKENPSLTHSLAGLQVQLNEEEELMQSLAHEQFSKMVDMNINYATFSITEFNEIPVPLQRRIFHLILNYLYTHEMMDKDYFNTFKEWIQSDQKNSQYQINKQITLIKAYDECRILKGSNAVESFHNIINVGETLQLPNGWSVSVAEVDVVQDTGNDTFLCDKHHISLPLMVRTRKHGDRIKPKGMKGRKKVKDIFIDQKNS